MGPLGTTGEAGKGGLHAGRTAHTPFLGQCPPGLSKTRRYYLDSGDRGRSLAHTSLPCALAGGGFSAFLFWASYKKWWKREIANLITCTDHNQRTVFVRTHYHHQGRYVVSTERQITPARAITRIITLRPAVAKSSVSTAEGHDGNRSIRLYRAGGRIPVF